MPKLKHLKVLIELGEQIRKDELYKVLWKLPLVPEYTPKNAIEEPEPKADNADDERI